MIKRLWEDREHPAAVPCASATASIVVKDYRMGQFDVLIHEVGYREVRISMPKKWRSRTAISLRREMMVVALVAAPTCSLSHPVILDGKVRQATITRRTPTLHIADIDRSLQIVGCWEASYRSYGGGRSWGLSEWPECTP